MKMTNLIRVKMSRGGRPLIVRFLVIEDDVKHVYKNRTIRFESPLGYLTERRYDGEPRRTSGDRKIMIKDVSCLDEFLKDYASFRQATIISYEVLRD